MFRVGQKVVCVDATNPPADTMSVQDLPDVNLVKGNIYTVTAVGLRHPYDLTGLPCITVAEEPDLHFYWAHRFRPLVERKTDIGFAHEILRKVSRKQTERA